MTDPTLRQALAYAARGWPVFPCLPGQKIPATAHGYRDATTDDAADHRLVRPQPGWNLAIATGAPGPDVLDVDQHGPAGNGFAAFARLRAAGLLDGAAAYVRTPSGGLHAYFTGSAQRNGHLPAQPPGLPVRRRLRPGPALPGQRQALPAPQDHPAATAAWTGTPSSGSCNPSASQQPAEPRRGPRTAISARLARWVAAQPEGNRNAGLFWAANRALDADPAADLSPLAAAARQAGLGDQEITRTLDSARRTGQAPHRPTTRPRR